MLYLLSLLAVIFISEAERLSILWLYRSINLSGLLIFILLDFSFILFVILVTLERTAEYKFLLLLLIRSL